MRGKSTLPSLLFHRRIRLREIDMPIDHQAQSIESVIDALLSHLVSERKQLGRLSLTLRGQRAPEADDGPLGRRRAPIGPPIVGLGPQAAVAGAAYALGRRGAARRRHPSLTRQGK